MEAHDSREVEEIKEIRKTIKDTLELMGQTSGWVDLGIERICYLYDHQLQKAREEERERIKALFPKLNPNSDSWGTAEMERILKAIDHSELDQPNK